MTWGEEEFQDHFMSGWPRREFCKFSPDWNKSCSPQKDPSGDEAYSQLRKAGISFPVRTSAWATRLLFCLFEQVEKEIRERESDERKRTERKFVSETFWIPAYLLLEFSIGHWNTVEDRQKNSKNERTGVRLLMEEAKGIS